MSAWQCICCDSNLGTDLFGIHTDREYRVKRCRKCGVVATFPRPTVEELHSFYDKTYFSKDSDRVGGYDDYAGLPESNAREMWREFCRCYPAITAIRGRILDYGCATGGFLDEAQKTGWTCTGVELSEHAVKRARGFGIDIRQGDLFESSLEKGCFDVLTMWHVLEHVIDPVEVIDRAHQLLKFQGYLFIELPSWSSLGRRIRRSRWAQLRPPEHINFFTPVTLANLLQTVGFRVVDASSVYPSLTNRITLKTKHTLKDYLFGYSGYLLSSLGLGGYARVLAKKI
jgi:SAM-dependent methyltransferase